MAEIQVKDKLVTVEELGVVHNAGATGVKGNAESLYRTGNVNLTPANIGALPDSTTFVCGVKGNAESSYRSGQVNLTPANIGAVSKSSDTMTGNLTVAHSDDTYVVARSTSTGAGVYLDSASDGQHGIWSGGYYNGSAFVSNGKFIIHRNTDGKVIVADHYSVDEINAILGPTDISGDFTKVNANTLTAVKTGKVVTVYAEINNASGSTLVVCTCGNHSPAVMTLGGVYLYSTGAPVSASVWAQPPSTNSITIFASSALSGKIVACVTYIEQ